MNRKYMFMSLGVLAVVAIASWLVMTGGSAAAPKPTLSLQPCTLPGAASAQCGTLTVYENRAARKGRTIDLQVAVVKATGSKPAADPIFWLSGGPGGSAIHDIPFAMLLLGPANENRDLVFVDQRGTGGSHRITCEISGIGVSAEEDAKAVEEFKSCLSTLDADPAAYTTAWGMDDLDDVRAALGYEQINLYGGSYGPTAEQVYIQRHGEHVRSAVMTGASLLEVPMFEWMVRNGQAALDAVLDRCEADADCHAAYPNVRAEFLALAERLSQGPVALPLNDPATGQPVMLTRAAFNNGLHNKLLYNTATQRYVPALIHASYLGDWSGVARLASESAGESDVPPGLQLMSITIECNEDWAALRRSQTEALSVGSYLGYEDIQAMVAPQALCAVMPRPVDDALYGPLAPSEAPVLFLEGGADPQDPPANVAAAKARYPNSFTLVAPGQAHNYDGLPCRAQIIDAFIGKGSAQDLDASCLREVSLPSFEIAK